MRLQAVALQGAHRGYQLQQADLTCSNFSELTVYNIRRLFALKVGGRIVCTARQAPLPVVTVTAALLLFPAYVSGMRSRNVAACGDGAAPILHREQLAVGQVSFEQRGHVRDPRSHSHCRSSRRATSTWTSQQPPHRLSRRYGALQTAWQTLRDLKRNLYTYCFGSPVAQAEFWRGLLDRLYKLTRVLGLLFIWLLIGPEQKQSAEHSEWPAL